MWEWAVTAEWLQCCVVPQRHHMCFFLCLCPLRISSGPSFLSIPVISQGAGMGTARREVPRRLTLPAYLSPFSLFFLLEVQHHQGGAIQCDKLRSHPKKTARTHSPAWSWENTRKYSYKNIPHICIHASNPADILSTHPSIDVHKHQQTAEQLSFAARAHACACVCATAIKLDLWNVCAPESVSVLIYSLLITAC